MIGADIITESFRAAAPPSRPTVVWRSADFAGLITPPPYTPKYSLRRRAVTIVLCAIAAWGVVICFAIAASNFPH